jgi:SPP1 gp7 family putative phage head morphogenesis protein
MPESTATSNASAAQEFAALQRLTPTEAVPYLQARNKLTQTYGWQDLWHDEHAKQFTVSRLARTDLLQSIQDQITKSVNGELSRRDFMRDSEAMLKKAGWWGTKEVTDPATGEILKTTFDKARLKLIYDTNTRQAYAAGQWAQLQQTKGSHPYLRYITQRDDKVRCAHRAWDNVTLPITHPFWKTHFPPCGWRCRCRVVAVSQAEYDAGKTPSGDDMVTTAPDIVTREWRNPRTDQVQTIPVGIDPGFDYNPGIASAQVQAAQQLIREKMASVSAPLATAAESAGITIPAIAKAKVGQPTWQTLGLEDLRAVKPTGVTPPLLDRAGTSSEALKTLRNSLGMEEGSSIVVQTPVEIVRLLDASLLHIVEKRLDARERFANFILPTLRNPTEVWATEYDDATLRHRYIKVFAGAKYDLLVIVRVEPDGSIFWNMLQRERKKLNDLREGKLLYEEK